MEAVLDTFILQILLNEWLWHYSIWDIYCISLLYKRGMKDLLMFVFYLSSSFSAPYPSSIVGSIPFIRFFHASLSSVISESAPFLSTSSFTQFHYIYITKLWSSSTPSVYFCILLITIIVATDWWLPAWNLTIFFFYKSSLSRWTSCQNWFSCFGDCGKKETYRLFCY